MIGGECPCDGRRLITILFLHEGVPVLGDLGLDRTAVNGLLLELLVQLEHDLAALEGGLGVQGVCVAIKGQLDRGRDSIAHPPHEPADS